MMLSLFLASLLAFQSNFGVIEGTVTRSGTTEGLAGVLITITRNGQEVLESEPDAVTDGVGHFIIRNAAPGAYTIQAARAGYLSPVKDGVELEEGGSRKKIVVELDKPLSVPLTLSAGSALSGRVFDPLGRPADGATVEAILVSADGTTARGGVATSDDRGQYRVWGLAPGKYKIAVDYTSAGFMTSVTGVLLSLGGGRPLYVPDTWAKTYFPGTPDPERAALVEVGENASVESLDFGFQTAQAFKISGKVIDPGRDKRSRNPRFYLISLNTNPGRVVEAPRATPNSLPPGLARNEGAFELRGVRQGRYLLYAEDWQSQPVPRENFAVSQVVIDVASDISDVSLVMSGTAVVEGLVKSADQKPAENSRVVLIPAEERRGHPMFYKEARTDASGEFTIKGAMPGEYRLYVFDPGNFAPPPPSSIYALPSFLEAFTSQGVAVTAVAEERVNVSVTLMKKPQ
jgi:hypothetical protein